MKLNIAELGPRIAIIGGSCSGKSTLASQLTANLNAPVYHLDRIKWQPGQTNSSRPDADYKSDLQAWVLQDRWIIEGCYTDALPYLLPRATGVVYLNPNRWVCLWRYFKRLKAGQKGICDGDIARFDASMVKWILWDFPHGKQPQFERALQEHAKVVKLKTF